MIEISQNFGENNQAGHPSESNIIDSGIFQLQTIDVEGIKLNLFFDSGCEDIVAKQILSGRVTISGVGNQKSVCHDGVYSIRLPLVGGENAVIRGLCMSKVTTYFPVYPPPPPPLHKVDNNLRKECKAIGGTLLVNRLPNLPKMVGGETDILIGIN